MATLTLTEILGDDDIAASRVVINENFKATQNGVNAIEQRLNTSFSPGASLNVGSAQILKYTRPVTDNIFLCQASAEIQGNTNLLLDLNIGGSEVIANDSKISGNVTFDGLASGGGVLTLSIQQFVDNSYFHTQFGNPNTTLSPNLNVQALSVVAANTVEIPTTGLDKKRFVYLDMSSYTGTSPNDNYILRMPSGSSTYKGQIIRIGFSLPSTVSTPSGVLLDVSVNFMPEHLPGPIAFAPGGYETQNIIRNCWLELTWYDDGLNSGWKIIDSSYIVLY